MTLPSQIVTVSKCEFSLHFFFFEKHENCKKIAKFQGVPRVPPSLSMRPFIPGVLWVLVAWSEVCQLWALP